MKSCLTRLDKHCEGFTLTELLVVISIIALMAALSFPALGHANAAAKSAVCKSNLRQIGIGLSLYVNESARYPLAAFWRGGFGETNPSYWSDTLLPYCGSNEQLFLCSVRGKGWRMNPEGYLGYDYNRGWTEGWVTGPSEGPEGNALPILGLGQLGFHNIPVPESRVRVPSDMLAIGEMRNAGFGWPGGAGDYLATSGEYRHLRSNNALFCDGHVEAGNSDSQKEAIPDWPSYYKPDAAHAKRWNNDNQPHPELWPSGPPQ